MELKFTMNLSSILGKKKKKKKGLLNQLSLDDPAAQGSARPCGAQGPESSRPCPSI